ncbi:hypothetical protein AVEN_18689-1 [Araneus ventricosus]|uniref:Uncharacterized protein n=1 Tax=Araneus ventricosus TaxID=182803 RepID=A0A4Y2IBA7_ARAVE|nr:hypothetical protein AVEN_18689-1 [Araneus ventricosus]
MHDETDPKQSCGQDLIQSGDKAYAKFHGSSSSYYHELSCSHEWVEKRTRTGKCMDNHPMIMRNLLVEASADSSRFCRRILPSVITRRKCKLFICCGGLYQMLLSAEKK